jgi:hypothetical protein
MRRLSVFLVLAAAVGFAGGCSSDPDTPLGAGFLEDSLIQSQPGEVFQDTIAIGSTDTTFVVNSFYSNFSSQSNVMLFGRTNDFESWMLVRVDFSNAGEDTLKTVTGAQLTLPLGDGSPSGPLGGLFYETSEPFADGDTLTSISLSPNPIPDSTGVNVDRTLSVFPRTYSLPDTLVQRWIRGEAPHNGIAIVLNDTTTTVTMTFANRLSSSNPFLRVFFSDGTDNSYLLVANGTFTKDLAATDDLRLSDGDARRIWLPVDLSRIAADALLHEATLLLRVVPGSFTEGGGTIELYAPEDSVIGSTGILSGASRLTQTFDPAKDFVEFPIRNIIERFIADTTLNYGLVTRYLPEGGSVRRIDFHPSTAADTLRPVMRFTFSTPPTFPPDN